MIVLCKICLFFDILIFESPYRSIFAQAVSLNWEILESIKSRSFIRAERSEEKL